jgi:hypothetical protein
MTPHDMPYLNKDQKVNSDAPTEGEDGACRALFKHENADPSPFDFGSKASCETRTESMKMEPVKEARRATVFTWYVRQTL